MGPALVLALGLGLVATEPAKCKQLPAGPAISVEADPTTTVSSVAGGAFVYATNAASGAFSYGQVWLENLPTNCRLVVNVEALDLRTRTIEIILPGGFILLGNGRYGYWASNEQFAKDGWKPQPKLRLDQSLNVVVENRGGAVKVAVNGASLDPFVFTGKAARRLALGAKAEPRVRARILVRHIEVCPL